MKFFRTGILLIIFFMLFSCRQEYEDVVFVHVKKLEINDIEKGKILATADAVFNNPNSKGGKVSKVDIDVFLNNEVAARIIREENFKVKPNSEFTIPLNMEIDAARFTKDILGNIFKRDAAKSLPIDFDGNIWVSVYGIRKKVPIQYKAELRFRL